MDLVGGNTDFRTQAVFETVGETGGGVHHHRAGVHFGEEAAGQGVVLGDDGFGMARAVAVDVLDGFINILDDFHRQYRCQVFLFPVGFRGRLHIGHAHAFQKITGLLATTELHACLPVLGGQLGENLLGDGIGHQQGFGGVAGAITLGFGIKGHADRLGDIRLLINVGVAVAIQVFDDRHAGVVADALDQALATPGHNDVHIFGVGDQLANGGAVGGLHHLDGGFRQAGGAQALADALSNGLVGIDGFGAAPQDG